MMQFKLIKIIGEQIGKKYVLPAMMENISTVLNNLTYIKNKSNNDINQIKQILNEFDLEFKIKVIGLSMNDLNDEQYTSTAIHHCFCGLYEVLDDIKIELNKIIEERNYMETSWYHYIIGWTYYTSPQQVDKIIHLSKLLMDRYQMLLEILRVKQSN